MARPPSRPRRAARRPLRCAVAGTSAWNLTLTGRKKWILLPPDCPPPGVHASADGAEVTSPVSLVEWFVNFYDELHRSPHGARAVECVAGPGDAVFVPSGWWHAVLNLGDEGSPVVAVTQNFVSRANLPRVLHFLRCVPPPSRRPVRAAPTAGPQHKAGPGVGRARHRS